MSKVFPLCIEFKVVHKCIQIVVRVFLSLFGICCRIVRNLLLFLLLSLILLSALVFATRLQPKLVQFLHDIIYRRVAIGRGRQYLGPIRKDPSGTRRSIFIL
jgi:low temperature requirement protein LtrA